MVKDNLGYYDVYPYKREEREHIVEKEIVLTKDELIDFLQSIQKKYGKCFDLIEAEELGKIVDELC